MDGWSEIETFPNGKTYDVPGYGTIYVPNGADASTPMCGNFMGDSTLNNEARTYAAKAGCKSILFFGDKLNSDKLVDKMAAFSEQFGIGDTDQMSFMGGSGGGGSTLLAGSYAIEKGYGVTSCTSLANWRTNSAATSGFSEEELQAKFKPLIENDVPLIVGYYDSTGMTNAEYLPSLYAKAGGKAFGFKLEYGHNHQVMLPYSAGFIDILNGREFDEMGKLVREDGYIIFNEDGTVQYGVDEATFLAVFNESLGANAQGYFRNKRAFKSIAGLSDFDGTVCNDTEIRERLNEIRRKMKSSIFVNNEINFTPESTSQIPMNEVAEVTSVLNSLINVYQKLAHDTEEIAFMCQIYKMEDAEFAKYANEINGALKAAQEAASNSNGSTGYYAGGGYGGGYGGYGGGGPALAPSTDDNSNENNKDDENKDYDNKNDNIKDDKNKDYDSKNDSVKDNENKDNENKDDENNEDLSAITTTEFDDYWPDYDNLASDEDRLVYNCDDEFKLIVHTDGDEVTGLEHMFKFASEDEALEGLEKIKQDYKDVDNVDKIILNDNLIKVLFNKLAFKDLTREDAKAMYEHLGEITSVENK